MRLDRLFVLIPLSAALLIIATWLFPGREGIPALMTILAPHAALAALLVTVVCALVVRGGALRLGLVVLGIVMLARFSGEWLSHPSNAGPATFTVATWNMEWTGVEGPAAVAGLVDLDADVVALQELTPEQAAAIETSASVTDRYPYRRLEPGSSASGIGLLSRHPLTDVEYGSDTVFLRATLESDGERITILSAHPYGPRIGTRRGIPVAYHASGRDRRLAEVRTQLDAAIGLGAPVILIGDFNVSPTEAGYRDLTAGLTDAHVEVGQGPGWTWRPSLLGSLPMGVLRIDLVLSTPQLTPVESRVACPAVGDHCQVIAGFAPLT